MRKLLTGFLLLILVVLQSSCGLYIQRQIDGELGQLGDHIQSRWYPNNVARWEDYSRSVRSIYAKYRRSPDVFDELALSYIIALASHLDRRTISEQEFRYLSLRMLADVELEQQKLALRREAVQAQRGLQQQLAWQNFWANWQRNYQQSFGSSIITCQAIGQRTISCF